MKSKQLGFFIIGLIVLYGLLRITGVLQFYDNETPAMEPAIKTGSMMVASNIKSPKRYSIVAFDVNPYLEKNQFNIPSVESIHVSRIVALENEEIEIINGVVHVNNSIIIPPYELLFTYMMKSKDFEKYKKEYNVELMNPLQSSGQYVYVTMTNEQAKEIKEVSEVEQLDSPITGGNLYRISEIVEPGWTTNNFGPVKVPKGNYFMISDNRNNSLDSRIYGFISKEKIVGVKI